MNRHYFTIGVYIQLAAVKSRLWEVDSFSINLLHRVFRQVLAEQSSVPPITIASLNNEIIALVRVIDLAQSLSKVRAELTALGVLPTSAIAWYCNDEGVWRDWLPKSATKAFGQRVEEIKTWSEQHAANGETIRLFTQLLEALCDSPEAMTLLPRLMAAKLNPAAAQISDPHKGQKP
jgi:hypothetical protein